VNRPLTVRENEILALIARGLTNAEIGCALGVTEKTVKNIALVIFPKLGARNRVEAALAFHGLPFGPQA